ncbi:MAG: phage integrase N-terminal SAM-like domain-containing protein [Opitutales bacterium]|nr:phage integrase N-terminal SAM-like domain-containing protein [Opitutales bacterium]
MLRFAEYLELQDFRQRTAATYYRALRLIAEHFGKDPAELTEADLRGYFVYLRRDRGWAPKSCRQFLAAAKHFYRGTLGLEFASLDQIKAKDREVLPTVLIPDEVARVIRAVPFLRYRVPLLLIYASGLRVSEWVSLTVDHIDGPGNRLFVRRFLEHALPAKFHRIRYRGFLYARGKAALEWLQLLLDARLRKPVEAPPETPVEIRCPHCGAIMFRTRRMPRAPPDQRNEHFFHTVAA